MDDIYPLSDSLKEIKLKHPKYRLGWVHRDGALVHVCCTAKWILAQGQKLFEACPVRSLLLLSADASVAELSRCSWLAGVQHIGLVLKKGAALDEFTASPYLRSLTSLDLNWTSNDPAYPPHELSRKTLQPLLDSPLLGQLESLRTSCSSSKLLLAIVEAASHVKRLGLRLEGGFSKKDAVKIGQAMQMPNLEHLSVPTGVWPALAPKLSRLRVRGGGLPMEAELDRLEDLQLDSIFVTVQPS